MSDYHIGISGLSAAQQGLNIVGNNIANAATEGYHRQRVELRPAYGVQLGGFMIGGGVEVVGSTRMVDKLLEQEILRLTSSLGQVSTEAGTLQMIETSFGEFSGQGGLNAAINDFFNALSDLTAHPDMFEWQKNLVSTAQSMSHTFRNMGEYFATLEDQIKLEAQNVVQQINVIASQIAELNDEIGRAAVAGGQSHNLADRRDQLITELAGLIGIETVSREYGAVDVAIGGIPLVLGATSTSLEVVAQSDGCLALGVVGGSNYTTEIEGGRLGGLFSLKNSLISNIHSDLDSLAKAIIQQVNQYHVQGIGSYGSFTELTGWLVSDPAQEFADYSDPPVSDGSIFIRITDTSTGAVTREEITVDADAGGDTLNTLAAAIDALTGVSASTASSRLTITAETGYEFDFLPGVLSEPTSGGLSTDVNISGIYTGSANQTYTCTVLVDGQVGVTPGLEIEVSLGATVVKTVNVGAGYSPGDRIDIGDGIYIAVDSGSINATEEFTIDALGDSDTSEVLAAVGINTFFSGTGALDMAVCSDIVDSPERIATYLGADMTDDANINRLKDLKDKAISDLGSLTIGEFYRQMVADCGQDLFIKNLRTDNIEVMVKNLRDQRSEASGVDINAEAAKLLVFEQMFEAMARYLAAVQSMVSDLMDLVH